MLDTTRGRQYLTRENNEAAVEAKKIIVPLERTTVSVEDYVTRTMNQKSANIDRRSSAIVRQPTDLSRKSSIKEANKSYKATSR